MIASGAGKRLWLLTGAALIAAAVTRVTPLPTLIIGAGVWSVPGLLFLVNAGQANRVFLLTALAVTGALSLFTRWSGLAALAHGCLGAILLTTVALVLGVLRLLGKKPSTRALAVPLTMISMGAAGLMLSAWASNRLPPVPVKAAGVSDELKYIYETDQSDRITGITFFDLTGRDAARLKRVKTLYRANQINQPQDQYNAAMIFQHGSCADDYQVAYQLSKAAESVPGSPKSNRPFSHLAYDRWQLSLGKPQLYGTQFPSTPAKRPCSATR